LDAKRKALEALLHAKLVCPQVHLASEPARANNNGAHGPDQNYVAVEYAADHHSDECISFARNAAQSLLDEYSKHRMPFIKEAQKVIRRAEHVMEQLGADGLMIYLREGVLLPLKVSCKARHAASMFYFVSFCFIFVSLSFHFCFISFHFVSVCFIFVSVCFSLFHFCVSLFHSNILISI
jgi:hypothetical protein